ncbi:uncharacterized protein LOC130676987 [Microplitis mediator]|uniref:uncharacterized protein LOC130676987 n=1 Tax=Microplitis mediator TaxID=375433 RepID=UPI0025553C6A|nr:uncharacterized protein LOC130676987 [Microplitis mediator]
MVLYEKSNFRELRLYKLTLQFFPYLKSHLEEFNWILHKKERSLCKEIYKSIAKPQVILPPSYLILKSNQLDPLGETISQKMNSNSNYKSKVQYLNNNFSEKKSLQQTAICAINKKNIESNQQDRIIKKICEKNENYDNFDNDNDELKKSKNDFIDTFESSKIDSVSSQNILINKKIYPRGREFLLRHWQDWLQSIDDEFKIMSEKVDYILNNVYETTRMILNINFCDNYCGQEFVMQTDEKQIPSLLIDSLVFDSNRNKKCIGTLTLNLSPQSLSISEANLLQQRQITLSRDKLIKKKVICGLVIEDDKVKHQIETIYKDLLHISQKIKCLSKPVKNISSCNCTKNDSDYSLEKVKNLRYLQRHNSKLFNEILQNFLKVNEKRENIHNQTVKRIDHTTCTQRFFNCKNYVKKNEPEKCAKCNKFLYKCKESPLKQVLKNIDEEKAPGRRALKKEKIEKYKDDIKISINGMKQSNVNAERDHIIISGVTLLTPIQISPESSKSYVDSNSSLNQHHHWSETKFTHEFHPIHSSNEKNLITNHNIIEKEISDNYDKFSKETIGLLKKHEELLNNKNLVKKNFEIKETNRPIDNSKHLIKKWSRKRNGTREIDKERKVESAVFKGVEDNDNNNNDKIDEKEIEDDKKKSTDFNENKYHKKSVESTVNLAYLMKIALKEMANKNFLLAKLPACEKLPQLQMWIKYREGFIVSRIEEDELLDEIQDIWNEQSTNISIKIIAPKIKLNKHQDTFNYSDINKLKRYVKELTMGDEEKDLLTDPQHSEVPEGTPTDQHLYLVINVGDTQVLSDSSATETGIHGEGDQSKQKLKRTPRKSTISPALELKVISQHSRLRASSDWEALAATLTVADGLSQLKSRLELLEGEWHQFNLTHDSLALACTKEFLESSYVKDGVYDLVYRSYINAKGKLIALINSIPVPAVAPAVIHSTRSPTHLPALAIPKFDERYENWPEFRDSFTSMVINAQELAPVQRVYSTEYPSLKALNDFLVSRARAQERVEQASKSPRSSGKPASYSAAAVSNSHSSETKAPATNSSAALKKPPKKVFPPAQYPCDLCKGDHFIVRCTQFLGLTKAQRTQVVVEKRLYSLVNSLKLKRTHSSTQIIGIDVANAGRTKGQVALKLSSRHSNDSVIISAHILGGLTTQLPSVVLNTLNWDQYKQLQLADPAFMRPGPIDIIIDANHYGLIIKDALIKRSEGLPIAQDTIFGWILLGPVTQHTHRPSITYHAAVEQSTQQLQDLLSRFWTQEEIPVSKIKKLNPDEEACDRIFNKLIDETVQDDT